MTASLAPFSVAELQGALRALRSQHMADVTGRPALALQHDNARWPSQPLHSAGWGYVTGAHHGAGCSTVALAIADAVARQAPVTVVECAASTRSGLAATTSAELGPDESGDWLRGTRGDVTVLRRSKDEPVAAWPDPGTGVRVVADVGVVEPSTLGARAVVLVCRATIPGFRYVERFLGQVEGTGAVAVAAVGARRLPRELAATLGSRTVHLRDEGRLVAVPHDDYLALSGPTSAQLPRPVAVAGFRLARLVGLIEDEPHLRRRASTRPSERTHR